MADEWQIARIEDVAEKVGIGPFGSSIKVETFVSAGIPVINGQHLRSSRLEEEKFNYITEDHADRLKKANVGRGDVVFTHRGNIGQVSIIPRNSKFERYVISQSQFFVRCNHRCILPDFLVYYFRSAEGQQALLSNASQVGVPSIAQPVSFIRTLEIPLPPLLEQRAIAHILGTLDDKIELNRKMNETLEAIARALFKSWFVDFDPVRAKAEGRDTGLPKEIADLFPDEFEDSELREIPKGWKFVPLPEAVRVNPARSLKKGEVAPYLDMANMPTHGHCPEQVVNKPFGSGMKFINGDTLVARITPCLENGKTAFVDFLEDGKVGWGSTEYIVLRPNPPLPEEFAYCLARTCEFREFAIQNMTGSSGRQRVSADALWHFQLCFPPVSLLGTFGRAVQHLFSRVSANARESRNLVVIRDTLLPKLISGELRVPEAERFIEQEASL